MSFQQLASHPLPYAPLPLNARKAAYDSIHSLGFAPEAFLDEYLLGENGTATKVNAVVFAHPRLRTPSEYASFTIFNAVNGDRDETLVQHLALSLAPFHLIHRTSSFSFWASTTYEGAIEAIPIAQNVDYEQLDDILSEYREDLNPDRVVAVKQGRAQFLHSVFERVYPIQMSLWALEVTQPTLVKYFGSSVNALREANLSDETVERIATQLLGIMILADTGALGEPSRKKADQDLGFLVNAAASKFRQYFEPSLFEQYYHVAEQASQRLNQINFASFMPDMLRALYLAAYDKQQGKALGRYDTPLYLTRKIWEMLPVEFLRPENRIAVDMTCGSGSFLIAGFERLSRLTDTEQTLLPNIIRGNDKDHFTARLSKLALLLYSGVDGWNVDSEDALSWQWLNQHRPNIIIGNPPFGGNRKTLGTDLDTPRNQRRRIELANLFLARAIARLAPGGLLAMIMPQSFSVAEASPAYRKELLEVCDLFELWELPIPVFPDATAGTIVLFAQKKMGRRKLLPLPTRIRTVQPYTLNSFKSLGVFTASTISSSQANWGEEARKSRASQNTHLMDYHLVLSENHWKQVISRTSPLSEVALVIQGAIKGNHYSNNIDEPSRVVPWLTNAKRTITKPFVINYDDAETIEYPSGLHWPRREQEHILSGKKVILTRVQNPSWGRRVKAAVERNGYYVSDSFWIIVPKQGIPYTLSHEVLAAIVNWKVSNGWLVDHLRSTTLVKRVVQTIPVPINLSAEECRAIEAAVFRLESDNHSDAQRAEQEIDAILQSAYSLDHATYQRLSTVMRWDRNPQLTLDSMPRVQMQATWNISGITDSVQPDVGTITLWLDGFNDLQTTAIDPAMPGWMLRQDAAFRTQIPKHCAYHRSLNGVVWGSFHPQAYSYLSEEELVDKLANLSSTIE